MFSYEGENYRQHSNSRLESCADDEDKVENSTSIDVFQNSPEAENLNMEPFPTAEENISGSLSQEWDQYEDNHVSMLNNVDYYNHESSSSDDSSSDGSRSDVSSSIFEITQDEDDIDLDNFASDCTEDFREYDNLQNWVMFEKSNISVWEVLNMVTAITLRYHLSDEAQQAILKLIKVLAGDEFENFNISKYLMNKLFNPPDNIIAYVFYCKVCYISLGAPILKNQINNEVILCDKCHKEYRLSKSEENFFVTVNLKYQIEALLKNNYFRNMIHDQLIDHDYVDQDSTINDVLTSDRYLNDDYIKSKKENGDIVLTLNVNTDGTPQFESGPHSFWPIQCSINEIPIKLRSKFILLGALWYTVIEPCPKFMNLYLSTFINQINSLMENGIKIINEIGECKTYFCKIFSFPVDSVARPIMQNRLQFNGLYGCSWCYIRGTYSSGCMRFLQTRENPRDRSHRQYLSDVKKRRKDVKRMRKTKKNEKYTVRGVKGSSILSKLRDFDCVWGYPLDYMHGVLLGVTRQISQHWLKEHLSPSQRKVINKRLLKIKPTSEIQRAPRVLKSKRNKWKASEWRSWLLFYSIPCLTGILDNELLDSFKLFVKSVHKLLCPQITEDELMQCEIDILTFVHDCQDFYGNAFMTFNVHTLLHMVKSVRKNGPLWATSAFIFESNLFYYKQNITGPKGVINQVVNRTLRRNAFQNYLNMSKIKNSWDFCKTILNNRKEVSTNFIRCNDGAVLFEESSINSVNHSHHTTTYNRCIFKNIMYHSIQYTKSGKTDNAHVYLHNNKIGKILSFRLHENVTFIEVRTASLIQFDNLSHIWKVSEFEGRSSIIPLSSIISKIIFISVDETEYACIQPNTFECQ